MQLQMKIQSVVLSASGLRSVGMSMNSCSLHVYTLRFSGGFSLHLAVLLPRGFFLYIWQAVARMY